MANATIVDAIQAKVANARDEISVCNNRIKQYEVAIADLQKKLSTWNEELRVCEGFLRSYVDV